MKASGFRLPASGLGALLLAVAVPAAARADESTWVERAKASVERLWRKADPEIESANSKVRRGDPKGALDIYDKSAERFAEPKDQAALAFDRATAYIAEGRSSAPQAAEEARRALEGQDPSLHARAAYNLGFSLAEAGKRDEAIEAYGKALQLDANDADARYNLELLLREKEKKQQQGGQGQQDPKKNPSSKDDKQQQPPKPEQDKDQQKQEKEQEKKQAGQDQKKEEQKKPEQGKDPKEQQAQDQKDPKKGTAPEKKQQMAQGKPVDRTEAQRLLDALKASEKNLQVWRFGQRRKEPQKARDVAKDW